MRKTLKTITVTFLLGVFFISGCSIINPEKQNQAALHNDLFALLTTDPDPRTKYSEFINSNPRDKQFYENAFIQSQYQRPLAKTVNGGILPFNPNLAPEIASYFDRLNAVGKEIDTIVIITRNNSQTSKYSKITTAIPYETPYGLLEPNSTAIDNLSAHRTLSKSDFHFKQDSIIPFYAPFIKKSFPQAKIIPIIIEDSLSPTDATTLGQALSNELNPQQTFFLAISNFSNHPQSDLARFQTRYARSTIEGGDFAPLTNLNLDAPNAVFALNGFLQKNNFLATIFHSKGMAENRGYVMEFFTEGAPRPTPEATLIAVGDIMIDRYVRTLMEKNGEDYPFAKIDPQGLLRSAHIRLANLEGPVTDDRIRRGDMIFKFDPANIDLLIKKGINLVTLANNHMLDQGNEGFENTKKYLDEKGLNWLGHPLNQSDGHYYQTEINGLKIGFLGFHDAVITMNPEQAIADIKSVRPFVDNLVVTIHWGIEYKTLSSLRQQELAHAFIDAGATAIIGHHPHVVQEIEWYKDKPIIYSLGNFIFDQYWSTNTQKGLSVGLIFTPDKVELYRFPLKIPMSQPELEEN